MKCTHCGTELQDGTPVCPKCGERLTEDRKPEQSKGKTLDMPERNPFHKRIAKTIIILVIVAVAAVAFVLYGLPAIQNQLNPPANSVTLHVNSSSSTSDPADAGAGSKDANTPTDEAAQAAKESSSMDVHQRQGHHAQPVLERQERQGFVFEGIRRVELPRGVSCERREGLELPMDRRGHVHGGRRPEERHGLRVPHCGVHRPGWQVGPREVL